MKVSPSAAVSSSILLPTPPKTTHNRAWNSLSSDLGRVHSSGMSQKKIWKRAIILVPHSTSWGQTLPESNSADISSKRSVAPRFSAKVPAITNTLKGQDSFLGLAGQEAGQINSNKLPQRQILKIWQHTNQRERSLLSWEIKQNHLQSSKNVRGYRNNVLRWFGV